MWDSTAETRFLVLPMRPAGTEGWSEDKLADLVTRDSMIGTGLPLNPAEIDVMDGVHDMGGMDGFGKVEAEQNEPPFHAPWEGRVLAMQRAMGYAGAWHIDHSRFAQEKLPPHDYLAASYYQRWALAMEKQRHRARLCHADELEGRPCADGRQERCRASSRPTWSARVMTRSVVLPPAAGPAALQAGRPRAHQEHPSGDAHAAAALRARQGRRGRAVPRLPRVSRTRSRPISGDNPQWLYTVVFDEPRAVGRRTPTRR